MSLYLTVEVRQDPLYQTSPPYKALMAWYVAQGMPHNIGWLLRVYNESPIRALHDEVEVDPDTGEWVRDPETNVPVTHEVVYNPTVLPPVSGYIPRPTY